MPRQSTQAAPQEENVCMAGPGVEQIAILFNIFTPESLPNPAANLLLGYSDQLT